MDKYVAMFAEIGALCAAIKPHCIGIFDTYEAAAAAVHEDMDEWLRQISPDHVGTLEYDYDKMFVELNDIGCEWNIDRIEIRG